MKTDIFQRFFIQDIPSVEYVLIVHLLVDAFPILLLYPYILNGYHERVNVRKEIVDVVMYVYRRFKSA